MNPSTRRGDYIAAQPKVVQGPEESAQRDTVRRSAGGGIVSLQDFRVQDRTAAS